MLGLEKPSLWQLEIFGGADSRWQSHSLNGADICRTVLNMEWRGLVRDTNREVKECRLGKRGLQDLGWVRGEKDLKLSERFGLVVLITQ